MIVLVQPKRIVQIVNNSRNVVLSGHYHKCVILHQEPTAFGYTSLNKTIQGGIVRRLTSFVYSCDTTSL